MAPEQDLQHPLHEVVEVPKQGCQGQQWNQERGHLLDWTRAKVSCNHRLEADTIRRVASVEGSHHQRKMGEEGAVILRTCPALPRALVSQAVWKTDRNRIPLRDGGKLLET